MGNGAFSWDIATYRGVLKGILGEEYLPLKRYFSKLFRGYDGGKVAFVGGRSRAVAELFHGLLRLEARNDAGRQKLDRFWLAVVTEEELLASENGGRLLVVQDLVIQGSRINELLEPVRVRCQQTQPEKWQRVLDGLTIRSFGQNGGMSVVALDYQLRLKPELILQEKQWRVLDRKLTNLVIAAGKTAPDFTLEREFSGDVLRVRLAGDPAVISEEVGTPWERHGWLWEGPEENGNYVCAFRAVKNWHCASYRVMPFVFLPRVTQEGYRKLRQVLGARFPGFDQEAAGSAREWSWMLRCLNEAALNCWAGEPGFSRQELEELLEAATADVPQWQGKRISKRLGTPRERIEDLAWMTRAEEWREGFQHASRQEAGQEVRQLRERNWVLRGERFLWAARELAGRSQGCCQLLFLMDRGCLEWRAGTGKDGFCQTGRITGQGLFLVPQRFAPYLSAADYLLTVQEKRGTELAKLVQEVQTRAAEAGRQQDTEKLLEAAVYVMAFLKDPAQRWQDWDLDFEEPWEALARQEAWKPLLGDYALQVMYRRLRQEGQKQRLYKLCAECFPG